MRRRGRVRDRRRAGELRPVRAAVPRRPQLSERALSRWVGVVALRARTQSRRRTGTDRADHGRRAADGGGRAVGASGAEEPAGSKRERATMADPSWRELNRAMWNERLPLHLKSKLYDLPGFRAGALSLKAQEIADLGDVSGKDLIHLQCHFGKDTLSWARLGARVTGLDFSEAAVEAAAELAREIGVDARFVTAAVYDAPAAVAGCAYDIVYTGVGALCWLPDMEAWAKVVFDLLRPGGQLYLFEFHPLRWIFDPYGKDLIIQDD